MIEFEPTDDFEATEIWEETFINGDFLALVWIGDFEELIKDSTFSEGVRTFEMKDFDE